MVDLDELDKAHAVLPGLAARVEPEAWDPYMLAVVASKRMAAPFGARGAEPEEYRATEDEMLSVATNAVTILNAWPEVSAELRAARAKECGDGACRYRPAEVTLGGRAFTVMNSRDQHALADVAEELEALRALADVVRARCEMANPGWAPEIRQALAKVDYPRTP